MLLHLIAIHLSTRSLTNNDLLTGNHTIVPYFSNLFQYFFFFNLFHYLMEDKSTFEAMSILEKKLITLKHVPSLIL